MDGKRQGVGEVKQADHIPEHGGYSDDQYSDRADMSRVNRVVPALFFIFKRRMIMGDCGRTLKVYSEGIAHFYVHPVV